MSNSLYHYCSLETFLKIVESKEIWLTNIFCMNDSAEHFWLREKVKKELDRRHLGAKAYNQDRANLEYELLKKLSSKEDTTDVYCFCMSELPDSLGQWRGYADDGCGVAIGFSREFLRAACQKYLGLRLASVIYDTDKQDDIVKLILDNEKLENVNTGESSAPAEWIEKLPQWIVEGDIWWWAAQCKNSFFKEEQEVRLIYNASLNTKVTLGQRKYRTRVKTVVPYYALPLEPWPQLGQLPVIYEIVLGPKCNQEFNEPIIRSILSSLGYNAEYIHVWRSEGTYRGID